MELIFLSILHLARQVGLAGHSLDRCLCRLTQFGVFWGGSG